MPNRITLLRRPSLTATVFAIAVVLAACSSGAGDEKDGGGGGEMEQVRLSLDWSTYTAYHAPFAVAVENGIYEKHGLNVTETLPGGSGDAILQAGSGETDMAWADLSTAAASMLQEVPVTSVAKIQKKNASGLTVLAGTRLETAQDVAGMRIGSTPGGSDSTLLGAFLNVNGIARNDVEIVNLPANGKFAALMAGKVDAISGQVYFYVSGAEGEGREAHGVSYSDMGLDVLDHGFVASDSFIKSNPEAITAFIAAYREALTVTVEDPAAACEILAGKSDGAVLQDKCETELRLWLPLITPLDDPEWGKNDPGDWKKTANVLLKFGDAEGDRAPEGMYTNDLLPPNT